MRFVTRLRGGCGVLLLMGLFKVVALGLTMVILIPTTTQRG